MRADFAMAIARVLRPWWRSRQIAAAYRCLQDAASLQSELDDLKQEMGVAPQDQLKLLNAKRQVYERVLGIKR